MRVVQGVGGVAIARGRAAALAAGIAALVLAADLSSKAAVRDLIAPNESVPVIDGVVWLTHVRNAGAAFGMLQGLQLLFMGISAAVIVGVAVYLARGARHGGWTVVSLGLLAGGSAGNLYDRLTLGRVTDFVDFRWFPVFNAADAAISAGVIVLVLIVLFAKDDDAGEAAGAAASDEGNGE